MADTNNETILCHKYTPSVPMHTWDEEFIKSYSVFETPIEVPDFMTTEALDEKKGKRVAIEKQCKYPAP